MKPIITNLDETMKKVMGVPEDAEVVTLDAKEELKKEEKPKKKQPRKQILRILLEVGIPRADGNIDIVSTENLLGITVDTKVSKLLDKLKPQLVDTLQKARDHEPCAIVLPKKSKIIMPVE